MKDLTEQWMDDDPAYQEWSETIEKQNQQQQDVDAGDYTVIDLSDKSWPEIAGIGFPEVEAFFNATKAMRSDSTGE